MKLTLIRHTRNRMRQYGITLEEIQDCIENPRWRFEEEENGKRAVQAWTKGVPGQWRHGRGPYLKVVYREEGDERVILTAGPREKLPSGVIDED